MNAERFLPLTPVVFEIALALAAGERHGYEIMQDVERRTDGQIVLHPGTLYRALGRLLDQGLIEELDERPAAGEDDERRRYYRLSALGQAVARAEVERLASQVSAARRLFRGGSRVTIAAPAVPRFCCTPTRARSASASAPACSRRSAIASEAAARRGRAASAIFLLRTLADVAGNAAAVRFHQQERTPMNWRSLGSDARYALRMFVRNPVFTRAGGRGPGAGHRRQHGDLHDRQRRAAEAAARTATRPGW